MPETQFCWENPTLLCNELLEISPTYSAVIRRDGDWWIGWIEEVPGVNSQGATREELVADLREALSEALAIPQSR